MKPKKSVCANCGDEFDPKRKWQKFCSESCAEADLMIKKIKADQEFMARRRRDEGYV